MSLYLSHFSFNRVTNVASVTHLVCVAPSYLVVSAPSVFNFSNSAIVYLEVCMLEQNYHCVTRKRVKGWVTQPESEFVNCHSLIWPDFYQHFVLSNVAWSASASAGWKRTSVLVWHSIFTCPGCLSQTPVPTPPTPTWSFDQRCRCRLRVGGYLSILLRLLLKSLRYSVVKSTLFNFWSLRVFAPLCWGLGIKGYGLIPLSLDCRSCRVFHCTSPKMYGEPRFCNPRWHRSSYYSSLD